MAQPSGVADPPVLCKGSEGLVLLLLVLDSVDGVYANSSVFHDGVEREAARLFLIYFK